MDLFLDIETRSRTLNHLTVGVFKYLEDCEITVIGVAIDDDGAGVHDWNPRTSFWVQKAIEAADQVIAHNAEFDFTVLEAKGCPVPVGKQYCTMHQAQRHGLPGGLEKLCEIFKIPENQAKQKEGRKLVLLFCKPLKDGSFANAQTHPEEWRRYREYCRLDVIAMRELHHRMPQWNDALERPLWELDHCINARGVCVDTQFARAAVEALSHSSRAADDGVALLTDGAADRGTQRARILKALLTEFGVDLPDMQAATLERRLKDETLPQVVRELIGLRLQSAKSSVAKFNTLLNCVSADARLRGALGYCGAQRTRRWAGRRFQPHNLPRPTLPWEEIYFGIRAFKAAAIDLVVG